MPKDLIQDTDTVTLKCRLCTARWKEWLSTKVELVRCPGCGATIKFAIPVAEQTH